MTTVTQILEAAYAKSTKNNPGTIATESTELLAVVQRCLDGLFAVAARVNPAHFGKSSTVAGVAGSWARPLDSESIFLVRDNSDASLVVVVPYDDLLAEAQLPAVYEWGQEFWPAGNANDPVAATASLDFFYSKRPDILTLVGDNLDAMWEEQFNELIVLDVAYYLAVKDQGTEGRQLEATSLTAERERWANRYVAFLEHSTVGVRKRWGHINRFNSPSQVPLFSIIGVTGLGTSK